MPPGNAGHLKYIYGCSVEIQKVQSIRPHPESETYVQNSADIFE